MSLLIANYTDPQEKLRALLSCNCAARAVFIEGGPSFGKSHLLKLLRVGSQEQQNLVVVELDKRRSVPAPVEVLSEIGDRLGWYFFPRLDVTIRELEARRPPQASVSNVTIKGSYNQVQAIAQESEDDRLLTAMRATRDFLADLQHMPEKTLPLILAFDGYDADASLIDRWFDRSLIPGLSAIESVRTVVCGRVIPETTVKGRVPLGRSVEITLKGVADPEEWLPVIAALKRRIPGNTPAEKVWFMRGIIKAHKAAPGLILTEIMLFEPET
jgi:hypothetical protein